MYTILSLRRVQCHDKLDKLRGKPGAILNVRNTVSIVVSIQTACMSQNVALRHMSIDSSTRSASCFLQSNVHVFSLKWTRVVEYFSVIWTLYHDSSLMTRQNGLTHKNMVPCQWMFFEANVAHLTSFTKKYAFLRIWFEETPLRVSNSAFVLWAKAMSFNLRCPVPRPHF